MKKNKTIRFLGFPLYKRREKNGVRKKYILGICYNKKAITSLNNFPETKIDSSNFNIAFVLSGGIGDIILGSVYITKFIEKLDIKANIYCFVGQSVDSIKSLLSATSFVQNIYHTSQFNINIFDLIVRLEVQFPSILYNKKKLAKMRSFFLIHYIQSINEFNRIHNNLYESSKTFLQQHYLLLTGKTRLTGMDITGQLGLTDKSGINLSIPSEGYDILKYYNLENKKFITIQRGVDVNNLLSNSIKLWSVDKYQKLISKIKKIYPDILIVQLGVSLDRCEAIAGCDLDLRGKTTFAEIMALLNISMLHIDGEGGLVHLRHFLCRKPSVVLFGPTSPKTRGYEENINIRSNLCGCELCEWIVGNKWQTHCIRNGSSSADCMNAITPDLVFEKIKDTL